MMMMMNEVALHRTHFNHITIDCETWDVKLFSSIVNQKFFRSAGVQAHVVVSCPHLNVNTWDCDEVSNELENASIVTQLKKGALQSVGNAVGPPCSQQ